MRLKAGNAGVPARGDSPLLDQLDFEFVLFASAVIDYDYIMGLIAKFSEKGPEKSKMSREQLIGLSGVGSIGVPYLVKPNGTVGTYTIDNANKTFVVFPADDVEQQKIADCLSSLDELIAAQARKLEALKVHKKGLMQGLFPSVEEAGL